MSIEVQRLQSWIGCEAQSPSGEKLGKIDDVYFAGDDPVAIGIRSGLAGRKHHAVTLSGASVSRDAVHVAVTADDLISTDGGPLTGGQISALSAQDERLRDVQPEQLEGWLQRVERRERAQAADAAAGELEKQALLRAEEEQQAAALVGDAESAAAQARRAREAADERATDARAAADETGPT